eukprot:TRINITY_DN75516_c0_g1_i1.p1 TRINITY_DN75516_c0_g1~~TRINITY_DN75516_c0_g1_i1.p1  ORF type:complete len:363 (+),score=65.21 TRINITY_DN75516_c0_g1_i1:86-1174(+)
MLALTLTEPRKLELLPMAQTMPSEEDMRDGDIIVRVEYSSVQPLDSVMFEGEVSPKFLPCVLGFEGVGMVLRSKWSEVDEGVIVAFMIRRYMEDFGCWQQEVHLNPRRACIVPLPLGVLQQEAAAGITSTLTALACLRRFGPEFGHAPGAVVVVTGACGAVGLAVLQLAALRGMRAVGLARGNVRTSWLEKEFGEIHAGRISAVDITAPGWLDLVSCLVGGGPGEGDGSGADGVIDGVGGEALPEIAQHVLRPRAIVVQYGEIAGPPDPEALDVAVRANSLSVVRESAAGMVDREDAAASLRSAFQQIAARKYRAVIWQAVNWRDTAHCLQPQPSWSKIPTQFEPWRRFDERRTGRIVLKID